MQDSRQDSGSAEAKKVLDALENDTKANIQNNNPGKVRFSKNIRSMTVKQYQYMISKIYFAYLILGKWNEIWK